MLFEKNHNLHTLRRKERERKNFVPSISDTLLVKYNYYNGPAGTNEFEGTHKRT